MSTVRILVDGVRELTRLLPRFETYEVASLNPMTVASTDQVEVRRLWGRPVQVGAQVLTVRVDRSVWVLGPTTPPTYLPGSGTVTGPAVSGLVPVAIVTSSGPDTARLPSTVTVTTGQRVGISWQETATGHEGHITGVLQANPNPAPPPPPPPPPPSESSSAPSAPQSTRHTVTAKATATWRGGWRGDTTHVYQGKYGSRPPNHGFWFYGPGAFATVPDRFTRVSIFLKAGSGVGPTGPSPVRLRLHTHAAKGRGYPTLIGPGLGSRAFSMADGQWGWFRLPDEWVPLLLSGAAAGVAAVSDAAGEYGRFESVTSVGSSGALKFE